MTPVVARTRATHLNIPIGTNAGCKLIGAIHGCKPLSRMQKAPHGNDGPNGPNPAGLPEVRQRRSDENRCSQMGQQPSGSFCPIASSRLPLRAQLLVHEFVEIFLPHADHSAPVDTIARKVPALFRLTPLADLPLCGASIKPSWRRARRTRPARSHFSTIRRVGLGRIAPLRRVAASTRSENTLMARLFLFRGHKTLDRAARLFKSSRPARPRTAARRAAAL